MHRFLEGDIAALGLEFQPWEFADSELYGIILALFVKMGLVVDNVTLTSLLDFIVDIDSVYKQNPYHSFRHACDVTYLVYFIVHELGAAEWFGFSKLECGALMIASLGHDILHPGTNNLYQIHAKTDAYQLFGKQSPLERQSLSQLWDMIRTRPFFQSMQLDHEFEAKGDWCEDMFPKVPVFKGVFSSDKYSVQDRNGSYSTSVPAALTDTEDQPLPEHLQLLHQIVYEAIINTDMNFHFPLLEEFAKIVDIMTDDADDEDSSPSSPSPDTSNNACSTIPFDGVDGKFLPPATFMSSTPELQKSMKRLSGRLRSSSNPTKVENGKLEVSTDSKEFCVNNSWEVTAKGHSEASNDPLSNCSDSPLKSGGTDEDSTSLWASSPVPLSPTSNPPALPTPYRRFMLSLILHACDISNAARPTEIMRKWSTLITEEFFSQGDSEKNMGIPVSPNMDRESTNQARCALEFNTYVVRPLFQLITEIMPPISVFAQWCERNKQLWECEVKAHSAISAPPPTPTHSEISSMNETLAPILTSVLPSLPPSSHAPPVSSPLSQPPLVNGESSASVKANAEKSPLSKSAEGILIIRNSEDIRKSNLSLTSQATATSTESLNLRHIHSAGTLFPDANNCFSSPQSSTTRSPRVQNILIDVIELRGRRLSVAAGTVEIPDFLLPSTRSPMESVTNGLRETVLEEEESQGSSPGSFDDENCSNNILTSNQAATVSRWGKLFKSKLTTSRGLKMLADGALGGGTRFNLRLNSSTRRKESKRSSGSSSSDSSSPTHISTYPKSRRRTWDRIRKAAGSSDTRNNRKSVDTSTTDELGRCLQAMNVVDNTAADAIEEK